MKDIVVNASPRKLKAEYTVEVLEPVFMDMREMKFYRYETVEYSESDIGIPNPTLVLREFNLFKETPKGHWIGCGLHIPGSLRGKAFWVSKTSKKRYAYPTKAEALNNFIRRKKRQKGILKYQLSSCQAALELGLLEQERQHYHGSNSPKVL